ncbi:MAG: 6,7-dimethyl-8-ribityllumazine synthase [Zetaproteobacteria bacterium CG12_big_fil_rev_8_21_14_0_65_55_1124]|nr:MAG: 6,7-dimethyl-8-ribityllumazine synthase [Zetaproteobacteria bacterium CG1_02_55_237]PIS19374.1 MAG: 6,7-dimethyl-8-ribityllumazine synthase [Zetaproteobacteria bacterium CG08_land_8_20_14_0_20_55_17]PIW43418.1 MAG: 6,7-dimethyl-8-ribityllumazine synthase [Zetaproteobacteria bacterium CG12_big_fil_rev_8_21_14_0_65_55_1124]PIY53615.1 MAG: 6,7-dimethyl-8-ribityllumazine synthase [Zetaproteobacteria bacterium CG_4_10_14_0_8_um_filter_55_43]PIZ37274.1 MAG: 6,7-dimethyl-8-ribityllumazine synt
MSLDAPQLAGSVDASGMHIGVIVSRFNEDITDALLDGARSALLEHGAEESDIHIVLVPGALEIGTIAARMADSGRYDALVCLGCVIRGGTAHFEHVCRVSMDMIAAVAARGDIGVGNGVLTVDTHEQAVERIGGAHGHKGAEAALTAVEVANLLRQWEA